MSEGVKQIHKQQPSRGISQPDRSATESSLAFNQAARRYDLDAAENPMMLWLRRESMARLKQAFKSGDTVLEIGAGSGEEAIALAALGVNVLATDTSPGMVTVIDSKIAERGELRGRVTTRVLPVQQLDELVEDFGTASFTGAYSSLGPINCTADLDQVAAALGQLVKPGGRVVISLLGKYCLWETCWYLLARKPRLAFRRWSGKARGTALTGGPPLDVYYWPVRRVTAAFGPYFSITRKSALPWALPPTYAAGLLRRSPFLFKLLRRLERATATVWPFYTLGDHVHYEMVRKQHHPDSS